MFKLLLYKFTGLNVFIKNLKFAAKKVADRKTLPATHYLYFTNFLIRYSILISFFCVCTPSIVMTTL